MDNQNFEIKEINTQETVKQPKIDKNQPPKKRWRILTSLINRRNLPKTLVIIVLVAVALILLSIWWGRSSFNKDKVEISAEAINAVSSGEEVILKINYKNSNRVDLKDAYLILEYPSGTFSVGGDEVYQDRKSLGVISKKFEGTEEFKVRFVGEMGDNKNINIKLNYQPQNISSRFENSSSFSVEINSVLVSINIEGPEKSMGGQEANYLIEYENKTKDDIYDLRLELIYDKDFKFKNAQPAPMDKIDNIWLVDALKSGEKRSINLIGNLEGQEGEVKILEVTVGKISDSEFIRYSQVEYQTLIAPSPLVLSLSLANEASEINENCIIDPGQNLRYKIDFKNNTDVVLRELILKAKLEDSVFDLKRIQLNNIGFFDSRENTITWSGGDIPTLKLLEPNQSGSVDFSLSLKRPIPMSSYNDKNFEATVIGEINTLTVPAKFSVPELRISDELSCKISSEISLKTRGYYYEPSLGIVNTGPVPPKVDQLTNYTIHWQIVNASNDVEKVKVISTLPQGINWTNYYINKVSNSQVYYNERTKEVSWEIEKLPAGVGSVLPIYEIIFQINLRPSINQVGQTPVLINTSLMTGKDSFTGVVLDGSSGSVDTSLPDDPKFNFGGGAVRE